LIPNEGVVFLPSSQLKLTPDVAGASKWEVRLEKCMLTYFEVEPNVRFETHQHEGEQITTVLEGELFFEVGEELHRVGPGDVIAVPGLVPHAVFTGSVGARAFDAWSAPFPEPGGNKG
jgi:quercetin dioxygenase-like cupin family protein